MANWKFYWEKITFPSLFLRSDAHTTRAVRTSPSAWCPSGTLTWSASPPPQRPPPPGSGSLTPGRRRWRPSGLGTGSPSRLRFLTRLHMEYSLGDTLWNTYTRPDVPHYWSWITDFKHQLIESCSLDCVHTVTITTDFRNCVAMAKDSRSTFPIIDENGCPVDPTIFPR